MKLLQNKLTREIGCLVCSFGKTPEKITVVECIDGKRGSKVWYYNSLGELNAEWCDYEEQKEYWFINSCGVVEVRTEEEQLAIADMHKQFGNYFETREEAEKAVEKLKAFKRLKDKGFRFNRWTIPEEPKTPHIKLVIEAEMDVPDSPYDLDLLFGGEE